MEQKRLLEQVAESLKRQEENYAQRMRQAIELSLRERDARLAAEVISPILSPVDSPLLLLSGGSDDEPQGLEDQGDKEEEEAKAKALRAVRRSDRGSSSKDSRGERLAARSTPVRESEGDKEEGSSDERPKKRKKKKETKRRRRVSTSSSSSRSRSRDRKRRKRHRKEKKKKRKGYVSSSSSSDSSSSE